MDIAAIPGFANSLKSYEEYNSEKTRDGIREKYEKLLASKDELEAGIKDTYAIGAGAYQHLTAPPTPEV